MFAGCLQIMWAHSHLIRAEGVGYSQIFWAENADVCRSYGLCLQAATVNALANGERIEIRGFGTFSKHQRAPRLARNPKTGEAFNLPAKTVVHFKPGKAMRDRVNDARDQCGITE
jgi:integration host factor subunit beta